MQQMQQTVVLFSNDQMLLKGLMLLLEDMGLAVISSSSYQELSNHLLTLTVAPVLLVFPFKLNGRKLAVEFVNEIRERFNCCIPTILLNDEDSFNLYPLVKENTQVLSALIKPDDLRNTIKAILDIRLTL